MRNAPVQKYINTLGKLHGEIQKNIDAQNIDQAAQLFQQCQDCAIQLGTMIETRIGEGTAVVGCLEEYCELLYQMHQRLFETRDVTSEDIYAALESQRLMISEQAEKGPEIQTEAVFLPSRAGHWGALESVWRAASHDPDCRTYVIAVPYYEKKPDGTLGKMHDESGDFPDDVPVVFYEDYDFQGRRPDMIYIQNPYDECNYTSSVHPFFYAKNLKQFTDKLIYIPWFTLEEIEEKDERGMQSTQHFVTVPGVMYADKVIVQSEQMRQIYIEILTKAYGEQTRTQWEEKVLGLGSPLYDLDDYNQCGESQLLPEWRKRIYRTDGSKRKVILYGTSVSRFLQYKEQMIKKLKSVLEVFREHQDEVIPVWKPDVKVTEDMSAIVGEELMQSYLDLVQQYKEEGWGVYDETEDMDQVVSIVDAYFGDSCYAAQMCRKAGLPVMLQDITLC